MSRAVERPQRLPLILFFVGYRSFSDSWGRHLAGLFMGSVLYLIAGPVSILFAVCVLLWEFVTKGIRWYISLVLLAVVLLLALASLHFSVVGEFRFAFLPDAYADPQIDGSKGYLAWIVFPFCILASHYNNNRIPKTANRKKEYSTLLIPILLLAGLCGGTIYFLTENTALGITLASNISLIVCTSPILTAFLSYLFKRNES